ncbi:MAG: cobalamin biosynthesis protein [Actinomycetota bacterium]
MTPLARRCLGAAAGLVADRLTGEPPDALHPVAWFGKAMQRVETELWADRRAPGIVYAIAGVGLGAAAGVLGRSTSVVVAVTTAGAQLRTTAERIGLAAPSPTPAMA